MGAPVRNLVASGVRSGRRRGELEPPDRSWEQLSPPQARLLCRLSVFVHGWTLDAARQVCSAEGLDAIGIESLHAVLTERSFLALASGDPPRYRMPKSVRATAVWKADESGESEWAQQRHATWCVNLVEAEQDEGFMAGDTWLRHLDSEVANFEAALAWTRGRGDAQLGIRLVLSLVRYWAFRGQLHQAVEWVSWAVSQADDATPPVLRAAIVRRAAVVQCRLGQAETAQALADEATVLYRRIGQEEAAGPARHLIGLCRERPGDTLAALEPSLEYARRTREVVPLAQLLAIRGQAGLYLGRLGAARGNFDECVELGRRHGRGDAVLPGLLGLARVELVTGNFAVAALQLGDALLLAERADDRPNQALALALSGELARRRGDHAGSRETLYRAAEIDGADGALALARDRYFLAHLERDLGVADEAHALFDESLTLGRRSDGPAYHEARCLLGLAMTTGDVVIARRLAEQAAEVAAANEDRVATAGGLVVLARLGRLAGDDQGPGTRMCQDAMRLYQAVGDLPGLTACLEELAALFADGGRSEAAARLLGAAETRRETTGYTRPPADEADYRRTRETATDALGAQWDRARMEGRTLSADDTVATAWAGRERATRRNHGWDSLTPAEHEVARLVAKGLTSADVGARLFISPRTVETHLAHLYVKLAIHSRRELARWIGDPDRQRSGPHP